MSRSAPFSDQPHQRAEAVIVAAFTELAQRQRYCTIRVADLVNAAGVARSTFYEHFRSKDEVLVAAMQPIILALVTASSGRAARSYVKDTVDHLWTRRSMARPLLDSPAGGVMERHLARAVADHGIPFGAGSEVPLYAVGIAASQLAMLRTWLAGQVTVTADKVTDHLIACAHLRSKDAGISAGTGAEAITKSGGDSLPAQCPPSTQSR